MAENTMPRTRELNRPEKVACPYEAAYETDVIVVGCGFAGLNAAVSAREAGAKVLVVDKGRPGYSGLAPWPSSFRWFDPERGDVAEAYRKSIQEGGDYLSNLHAYELWIKESKKMFERLTDWGILAQYPKASNAGDFYEREDFVGYRETFDRFDRRKKWVETLDRYEIPFLQHTMVVEVLTKEGRACGILGLHVPSGEIIKVTGKAVVLCTGGGSYKPAGFPTGGNTFDGEYIAYNLGLPIAGKEFEDFHKTSTAAPGNVFADNHWQYLENIWLCGGDVNPQNASDYASNKGNIMVMSRVRDGKAGVASSDGSPIQDVRTANYTRRGGSQFYENDPEEMRSGKMSTPVAESSLAGAATGMNCHLTGGIFCGIDDTEGKTAIPGLYTAGDGIHASMPSGASYPCGVGFTSCFCSIEGDHAGKAAAAFAGAVEALTPDEAEIDSKIEEITAPYRVEKGYDPNWARDVLQGIMAPYWVLVVKTEPMLQAALSQVVYMREHVEPKLMARTSHDLRLCLEMKHKLLSAELKLRASLERKESRGNHYREDYPYRDDEHYLCYMTQTKTEEGPVFDKVELPEDLKGDLSKPYNERYQYYFPGEPEAKGFTPPKPKWGGKRG